MKKFLLVLLLSIQFMNAQDSTKVRKNEVRFDVLSLITSSKFSVSYERYLNKNYSLGITTGFANSKNINSDFEKSFRNNIPKYEVIPFVRYNLSKGISSFYFAEIFANANGGDFKEIVRVTENNIDYYTTKKSKYSDVAIGASLGYKMYFKQKIALEFVVGFGRNLINTDKSPDYIQRIGLNLGYRF